MQPAIFLDRDGVIIENRENYVRHWDDVLFLPEALAALRAVATTNFAIVVVTNQACVGKGILTLEQAEDINQRVVAHVRAVGGRIDAAYLCPHRSDESCACRKPKPGMLLQAARELNLSLANSVLIGDAVTDMQAARAAGVKSMLVKTGRGRNELAAFSGDAWFGNADHLHDALTQLGILHNTRIAS